LPEHLVIAVNFQIEGFCTLRRFTNPVIDFPIFPRSVRVRDLVILIISVHEILHDGGTFKQLNGLTILERVREGGNPTIRVYV
jgi:hypothetical protein